jgi:YggT family protein
MDPFIASLLFTLIDIYLVFLFVRIFIMARERYDPIFDMICKATDPVITPLGTSMRSHQFNLAPLVPMAVLLLVKGVLRNSIAASLLGFADTLFQLYVLILIIISGFSEYYTNPIANFGQRIVNPVRAIVANFSHQVGTVNLLAILLLLVVHIFLSMVLTTFMAASLPLKPAVLRSLSLILSLTNVFALIIFIHVLLSWVSPDPRNPIVQLLALISYPIIEPIRRVVPPLGMLDLSPFIAIIALQVVNRIGNGILSGLS